MHLFLQIVDRLDEPVKTCDVEKDIQAVITAKGTGENLPEQMLPDFYAEDMNNIMNRDRRREVSDNSGSKEASESFNRVITLSVPTYSII